MSIATIGATTRATIRAAEAEHFGKLAADWWNPNGASALLHRVNPVRLRFLREAVDTHWYGDSRSTRPLAGRRALDVGCGAGLLCEPLARMGARVVGVDASPENIEVARRHADGSGLLAPGPAGEEEGADVSSPRGSIRYVSGELASLDLGTFDLVTAMEVIEHVADKAAFVAALAASLAPGGLMVLSTPNRTMPSRLLLVDGAEWIGLVPRGTHDWRDFITPDELRGLLADAGLAMGEPSGIAWSATRGLHLSDDLRLNYIVTAERRG